MADDVLQIVIRTEAGQTVAAFKSVSSGAQSMGVATEQAAKKSATGLRDTKKAADDLKLSAAALGVAFGLASRAAADETRQRDALNRLYGESADQINALSEAIQDNTNFSNDAARQAAITGSTLAANYELSAEQIGILIERSADLAQVHGIDLADAMSRVAGAIRGEGEAAELLGLNMSDAAVAAEAAARGFEGWTTTMTEAEKAAFRYQLVLEQTTATQGAAQDAANTTAGTVRHLTNEVQDVAVGFVQWTGPIGEATAALSAHAVEIAVVGGALSKLVSGLRASALVGSLGPAGLVVAAGAATVGIIKLADALTTSYGEAAGDARQATDDLASSITALSDATDPRALLGTAWQAQIKSSMDVLIGITDEITAIEDEIRGLESLGFDPSVDQAANQAKIDALKQQRDELDALRSQFGNGIDAAQEYAETVEAMNTVLNATGPAGDAARTSVSNYLALLKSGQIGVREAMDSIQEVAANLPAHNRLVIAFGEAIKKAGDNAATAKAEGLDPLLEAIAGVTDAMRAPVLDPNAEGSMGALARDLAIIGDATGQAGDIARIRAVALGDALEDETITIERYTDAIAEIAEPFHELAEAAALAEDAAGLMDTFASASAGVGDAQTKASAAIASANGAIQAQAASLAGWEGPVRAGIRALDEFQRIQDGIIAQQDVFNQQFSEYGSQISAIERAQEVLNRRREEGQQLTEDDLAFLEESTAALERLEGGQDDAAVSAGKLAAQYGENMSAGDRLNETISGVSGAVDGLSGAVEGLNATLLALAAIEATPSVSVAGLAEANSGLGQILARIIAIDGAVANATVNVGANIAPGLGGASGLFGMHGGAFARGGMVTIVAGEAGYERMDFANGGTAYAMTHGAYTVPTGTFVTPHPESAASRGGNAVSVQINFTGGVTTGNLDAFLAEAERAVRARFASLGVN